MRFVKIMKLRDKRPTTYKLNFPDSAVSLIPDRRISLDEEGDRDK